jgi:hypothetical protein
MRHRDILASTVGTVSPPMDAMMPVDASRIVVIDATMCHTNSKKPVIDGFMCHTRPDMFISTEPLVPLLLQARVALGWSQSDLAKAFLLSRRTVARYEAGHTSGLVRHHMFILAKALYPVDRSLARRAAVAGGETLLGLGLEKPEPPKPPPAPSAPPPPRAMLVDSVVYAAAEALDASPRSIRAAVLTAIERALVLGITLEDLTVAPASSKAPAVKPKAAKA